MFAASLLMLGSCSEKEIAEVPVQTGDEIHFGPSTPDKLILGQYMILLLRIQMVIGISLYIGSRTMKSLYIVRRPHSRHRSL